MKMISKAELESLRNTYKPGTRVELISMDDPQAPASGTRGTIQGVDDLGDILVAWDTGSSLSLIPGEDKFWVCL